MTITGINDIIKRRPTGLSMVVSLRPVSRHVHKYCNMVVFTCIFDFLGNIKVSLGAHTILGWR